MYINAVVCAKDNLAQLRTNKISFPMTYVEDISCVLKCCENTIMKIYYLSEDHPYIYAYRE